MGGNCLSLCPPAEYLCYCCYRKQM